MNVTLWNETWHPLDRPQWFAFYLDALTLIQLQQRQQHWPRLWMKWPNLATSTQRAWETTTTTTITCRQWIGHLALRLVAVHNWLVNYPLPLTNSVFTLLAQLMSANLLISFQTSFSLSTKRNCFSSCSFPFSSNSSFQLQLLFSFHLLLLSRLAPLNQTRQSMMPMIYNECIETPVARRSCLSEYTWGFGGQEEHSQYSLPSNFS